VKGDDGGETLLQHCPVTFLWRALGSWLAWRPYWPIVQKLRVLSLILNECEWWRAYLLVFSERELTWVHVRYMPSPVRLSVVCNVRAPYSGGSNCPQYFYGIRYLGHPLTSTENFKEISDLSTAISRKRCKIGGKLILVTNRQSYMSFQLVPKSVTLNGVMALVCVISANSFG